MNFWDWKFFLLMMALAINFHYTDKLEKAASRGGLSVLDLPPLLTSIGGQAFLLLISVAPVIGGLVVVIVQFFREPWYTVIISALSASIAAGIIGALFWAFRLGWILWLLSYPVILFAASKVYGFSLPFLPEWGEP